MSPRIITSEPAYRAPLSQSDRIRMGRVQPATLPVSRWEARAVYAVVALTTVAIAVTAAVMS